MFKKTLITVLSLLSLNTFGQTIKVDTTYHDNGKIKAVYQMNGNELHGYYKTYTAAGNILMEAYYYNNKRVGETTVFDSEKNITKVVLYDSTGNNIETFSTDPVRELKEYYKSVNKNDGKIINSKSQADEIEKIKDKLNLIERSSKNQTIETFDNNSKMKKGNITAGALLTVGGVLGSIFTITSATEKVETSVDNPWTEIDESEKSKVGWQRINTATISLSVTSIIAGISLIVSGNK